MSAEILRYAREELFNTHLYEWLGSQVSTPSLKAVLQKFAAEERKHYDFWHRWVRTTIRYNRLRFLWYQLLAKVLGTTFVLRLLEEREHETIAEYRRIADQLPEAERAELLHLIEDEETHETVFLAAVQENEGRLRYVGFIVLGLSDAIIEVTGVHAGFLGVSHRPLVAGIAGLIVGFAASISMGSAAYLQAKQNTHVSPFQSALSTSVAYLVAVVLLALPYFFLGRMSPAFWSSVGLALLLILSFVYYSSVLFERPFGREALESTGVLGATASLSYGFGELLRYLFPEASL